MTEILEQKTQGTRQTAYIVGLDEIANSDYVVSEGEWDPNYMLIREIKVSRANIMGVVIAIEGEAGRVRSFTVDDGRSSITVRVFESEKSPDLEIGDIVMVIGRPRVFNDEKYIVPEIIKKITDSLWIEIRKKEIERLAGKDIIRRTIKEQIEPVALVTIEEKEDKKESILEESMKEEKTESEAEEIISLIRKFDFGNGADIEEIIKHSKSKTAEKLIMNLLAEGDIFEIKAGRLKVLE
jgi:RPA family protein